MVTIIRMIGEHSVNAESQLEEETSVSLDAQQEDLTPEELANLGTHEYKPADWFTHFKQLLDNTLQLH